jgi:hypothetical protein
VVSRQSFTRWYRNRFVWVAVILLVSAGVVLLTRSTGPQAAPADLNGQIVARMRTTLEHSDPELHHHTGHASQQTTTEPDEKPPVVCGVHVYGYEPAAATALADVQTVYGFHLCGVAQKSYPWDVATKLAGPVILDFSQNPPGIQVVEATATVRYIDRLWQVFPKKYAELASREALTPTEMTELRRRYDDAAGL